MHRLLFSLALTALFFLAWSAPARATGMIIVQVRTEMRAGVDFYAIRVDVEGHDECNGDGTDPESRPFKRSYIKYAASSDAWKTGVRVAEVPWVWPGTHDLKVSALDAEGKVIFERPAKVTTENDKAQVVTVLLVPETTCSHTQQQERARCQMTKANCLRTAKSLFASTACTNRARACEEKASAMCKEMKPPPKAIIDGLTLTAMSRGDDLRGGEDNLNVLVYFRDGRREVFSNVNRGKRWGGKCGDQVTLTFSKPVAVFDITAVRLSTTTKGGIGGDNWNMQRLTITDKSMFRLLYGRSGTPLHRFTAEDRVFMVRF